MNTKIIGVGSALPKQVVNTQDILSSLNFNTRYGIETDWLSKDLGIKFKRISTPGTQPSELAAQAAQYALAQACDHGIKPEDIGATIFCGIERDQVEPATAHKVQNILGIKTSIAFDISNACYGFIDGLRLAQAYIETGVIKYALVTTGEVQETLTNSIEQQVKKNIDKEALMKMIGYLSLGDAGGAVVLGPSEDKTGFQNFFSFSEPQHWQHCFYEHAPNGGYQGELSMAKMVALGYRLQTRILKTSLEKLGWNKSDWLLSHQTGERGFDKIAGLNITSKDRMISTYHDLGNITSATFPVSYDRLTQDTRFKKGDKVFGLFGGSGYTIGQFGYVM